VNGLSRDEWSSQPITESLVVTGSLQSVAPRGFVCVRVGHPLNQNIPVSLLDEEREVYIDQDYLLGLPEQDNGRIFAVPCR
jgi:hypothetical protein